MKRAVSQFIINPEFEREHNLKIQTQLQSYYEESMYKNVSEFKTPGRFGGTYSTRPTRDTLASSGVGASAVSKDQVKMMKSNFGKNRSATRYQHFEYEEPQAGCSNEKQALENDKLEPFQLKNELLRVPIAPQIDLQSAADQYLAVKLNEKSKTLCLKTQNRKVSI